MRGILDFAGSFGIKGGRLGRGALLNRTCKKSESFSLLLRRPSVGSAVSHAKKNVRRP